MGEWFEKLTGLWEWMRFYPAPARWFFAVTATFICASAFLLLVYRRGASQTKAASDFAASIPLSVGVEEGIPAIKAPDENGIPNDRALRYAFKSNGGVSITPELPYLDKWNSGEEVESLNIKAMRFRWRFPVLDVRFSNATQTPLILNTIVIEVAESTPEDNPLVSVVADFDSQMAFRVLTPIPLELSDCVIEYNVDSGDDIPTTRPYQFKTQLSTPSGNDVVRVDNALAATGVMPELLRADPMGAYQLFMAGKPVPAMGRLKKGTAMIRGRLQISRELKALGPFKFAVEVAMIPPGPQVLLPSSATYDAMLREYGKDYEVEIRTANVIAPQQSERLLITLAAPRSSYHEFRLRLRFHDGRERVSGPIKLHLLRPE